MSNAQTFSFDSVGDQLPQLREREKAQGATQPKIKFGPALPLRLSTNKTDMFVMNTNLSDQVRDNMKSILLTNRGERVMQTSFGANLKAILTEYGTPGFEGEVMTRIKTSVNTYLPYVSLSEMQLEDLSPPPGSNLKVVRVTVIYSSPQAGITRDSISVTLSTVI